ncbi:Hypothetical protein ETEE_0583 [Edwardsiella anguillarum ET080813]|uniref:Uncharacterized protein n=1 Tax=Edwardsiella anguillarum ET080813 TaxID=667120 RepID=A0A076LJS8_9GAMM|nr:Hypothetical protein ETEE_0583 [Edwardsiella anguillarum ET080813]
MDINKMFLSLALKTERYRLVLYLIRINHINNGYCVRRILISLQYYVLAK